MDAPAPAPPPDWRLIETLFMGGASHRELAQQFGLQYGCIRMHMHRHGLTKARKRAQELQPAEEASDPRPLNTMLGEKSARVRNSLANELMNATEALQSIPIPKAVRPFKQRAEAANTLALSAEKVFGWQGDLSSMKIDIVALSFPPGHPQSLLPNLPNGEIINVTPLPLEQDNPEPENAA